MTIRLIRTALLMVLLVISFSFSSSQTAKPLFVRVSDTPYLIPTFASWETFITMVERSYEASVLHPYLAETAKLSAIRGYEPLSGSVESLIADFATYTQRDLNKIRHKHGEITELRRRGLLTATEYSQQVLSYTKEQVDFLRRSSETLRDTLVALNEEVGTAIWNRLVVYCNTTMKECMTLSSDEAAEDLATRAVWRQFDPKVINK